MRVLRIVPGHSHELVGEAIQRDIAIEAPTELTGDLDAILLFMRLRADLASSTSEMDASQERSAGSKPKLNRKTVL